MTFSEREMMIFYMVTISHSTYGRMASKDTKQQILKYLRDTTCKSVSNQEWQEIANDMRTVEANIMSTLMQGFLKASGGQMNLGEILKGKIDGETLEKIKQVEEKTLAHLSESNVGTELLREMDKNMTKKQRGGVEAVKGFEDKQQ